MSTWTGPWRVLGADPSQVYSVQNIVYGKMNTAHVARLRFYADADLNITAEIKDVLQHSHTQGECRTNALMHVAEDDQVFWSNGKVSMPKKSGGSFFVGFILLRLISC